MGVLRRQFQVRPNLRRGISQPHGGYVSGVNEGVVLAILVLGVVDRGVQGVGETVLKHPAQLGIGNLGGRFRTDYISAKYFFQDGWGGEASKGVTISGNAADNLKQGDDGNFGLNSNLEEGATYRLTVDFTGVTVSGSSVEGTEAVKFEKL